MRPAASSWRLRRGSALVGLLGCLVLAAAVRSIGFERVFLEDGTVVFALGDAFYHAHRALHTFLHFPDVLTFDPCINHPRGSVVPHPPLLDWGVGAAARLTGASLAHFERIAAWSPVVFGSLSVLPVYALGALLGGSQVGLGAAVLYALLPITVSYSRVGNMDHHAAAGLVGAVLLWLVVVVLDERTRPRRLAAAFAGLALARAAMLLLWTGSLLYLAVVELAIAAAAAQRGSRGLLGGQAASCALAIALVAPAVGWLPLPNGGPYSATELSRLHLLALGAAATVCLGVLALERAFPTASGSRRLLRAGLLSAAIGLALLMLPGLLEGLLPGFAFLAKQDDYTSRVLEQMPLFYESGGLALAAGERRLGYFAYLVPFLPLVFATHPDLRERRAPALLLLVWTLVFGALALQQFRYANDYAAAGCVGFALLLSWGARQLRRRGLRPARAAGAAWLAGGLLLAPAAPRYFVPLRGDTWAHLRGAGPPVDRALRSIEGTQLRFAQAVRDATPELADCRSDGAPLGSGILAHPAIGHVLHYAAQRATPADPFGPYIGRESFDAVLRFLGSESEAEAVAVAEALATPFVLTAEEGGARPAASIVQRLHREDGVARDALDHLGRFRLVAEGPAGGVPMSVAFERELRETAPYKLFRVVEGALLEVPADAGEVAVAEVPVVTSTGRRFRYQASAAGRTDGRAQLRLPYPTDTREPTRALGPYRVRSGSRVWRVQVSERAVREGGRVSLAEGAASETPQAQPTGSDVGEAGRGRYPGTVREDVPPRRRSP